MGWGQRWPARQPRPAAKKLAEVEVAKSLGDLRAGIAASPVLSALGVCARALRGRFYLERRWPGEAAEIERLGRITPLDPRGELLLEVESGQSSWREVDRGSAKKLIRAVAGDTKGAFHGLGSLDKSLRKSKGAQRRQVVAGPGPSFTFADTGKDCSTNEALYHGFGVPIEVIAEPADWRRYGRSPGIEETNEDRTRVLVRYSGESLNWGSFSGTCLYAKVEGRWAAYKVKPSESETIATAEAWLIKRKWKTW